jgi:hypothetical protein
VLVDGNIFVPDGIAEVYVGDYAGVVVGKLVYAARLQADCGLSGLQAETGQQTEYKYG